MNCCSGGDVSGDDLGQQAGRHHWSGMHHLWSPPMVSYDHLWPSISPRTKSPSAAASPTRRRARARARARRTVGHSSWASGRRTLRKWALDSPLDCRSYPVTCLHTFPFPFHFRRKLWLLLSLLFIWRCRPHHIIGQKYEKYFSSFYN